MLSDRQIYLIIRSSYSSVSSVPVTESAISPPTLRASCLPLPAAGQSAGRAVSPLPCGGAGCSCWFGVSSLRQRALSHTSGCGVASLRRAIPPLAAAGTGSRAGGAAPAVWQGVLPASGGWFVYISARRAVGGAGNIARSMSDGFCMYTDSTAASVTVVVLFPWPCPLPVHQPACRAI